METEPDSVIVAMLSKCQVLPLQPPPPPASSISRYKLQGLSVSNFTSQQLDYCSRFYIYAVAPPVTVVTDGTRRSEVRVVISEMAVATTDVVAEVDPSVISVAAPERDKRCRDPLRSFTLGVRPDRTETPVHLLSRNLRILLRRAHRRPRHVEPRHHQMTVEQQHHITNTSNSLCRGRSFARVASLIQFLGMIHLYMDHPYDSSVHGLSKIFCGVFLRQNGAKRYENIHKTRCSQTGKPGQSLEDENICDLQGRPSEMKNSGSRALVRILRQAHCVDPSL